MTDRAESEGAIHRFERRRSRASKRKRPQYEKKADRDLNRPPQLYTQRWKMDNNSMDEIEIRKSNLMVIKSLKSYLDKK